ncbi:MAG: class I SAM-dependent methyltransferase, partial [Streptosporangiaceae bacterium]
IATRGLTARGLDVTCIEPDPKMADILARRLAGGPPVRIERQTFESARLDGPFDGLVSAQAWHWTDHATRLDRAARLLRPGGFLGLIWNGGIVHPGAAFQAIEALYDAVGLAGHDPGRRRSHCARRDDYGSQLAVGACLAPVADLNVTIL